VEPVLRVDADEGCRELGCPCERNAECAAGICLPMRARDDVSGICTVNCDNQDCPEGYSCMLLTLHAPDVEPVCVPDGDVLCRSCRDDFDCGHLFGRNFCLEQLNGTFCATDCSDSRTCADPENYDCNFTRIPGGGPRGEDLDTYLCQPHLGLCHPIRMLGGAIVAAPGVLESVPEASVRFRLSGYVTVGGAPDASTGDVFRLTGGI
jgi:hypothetical protein